MASITVQERTTILKLVAGMFNAAPGATYLNEFTDAFVALNKDFGALAVALGNTAPFQSLYPSYLTAEEFANKFLATLGLKDNAEAQDWVQAHKNAGEDNASIIFQALVAIEASTADEFKAARDQLANKAKVAEHYSVTLGQSSDSLATLQGVVASITADPQTVEDAIGNTGGNAGNFTLTHLADYLTGTAGDDVFQAPVSQNGTGSGQLANTFETGDVIDGGAGRNTLKADLIDTGTVGDEQQGAAISATTKNIQEVYLRQQSPALDENVNGSVIDAEKMAGVEQWWTDNSRSDIQVEDIRTDTAATTFGMRLTDPGVSFFNYFNALFLEGDKSATSAVTLNIYEGPAGSPDTAKQLQDISVREINFIVGGETVKLSTDAMKAANTWDELETAIVDALAAIPGAETITVTNRGNGQFVLEDSAAREFQVNTDEALVVSVANNITFTNALTVGREEVVGPIVSNAVLDGAGNGSQGGTLNIGAMSGLRGVEELNVTVDRDSHLTSITSYNRLPGQYETLRNGEANEFLEVVNLSSAGAKGDLTIGRTDPDAIDGRVQIWSNNAGEVDNGGALPPSGYRIVGDSGFVNLREFNAGDFAGALNVAFTLDDNVDSRYLKSATDVVNFTYNGGAQNDIFNIADVSNIDISADQDFAMQVDMGAGDDRLILDVGTVRAVSVDGGEGTNSIVVANSHGTNAANTFAGFANFQTYEVEGINDTVHDFTSMSGVQNVVIATGNETTAGGDTTLIDLEAAQNVTVSGKNQTIGNNSAGDQDFGIITLTNDAGANRTVTLDNTARRDGELTVEQLVIDATATGTSATRTLEVVSAGARNTANAVNSVVAANVTTLNLTGTQDLSLNVTTLATLPLTGGNSPALTVSGAALTGDLTLAIDAGNLDRGILDVLTGTAGADDTLQVYGTNGGPALVSGFETIQLGGAFHNEAVTTFQGTYDAANTTGVTLYTIENLAAVTTVANLAGEVNARVDAEDTQTNQNITFTAAAQATGNVLNIEFVGATYASVLDVNSFRSVNVALTGDDAVADTFSFSITPDAYARTLTFTGGEDIDTLNLNGVTGTATALQNSLTTIDFSGFVGSVAGVVLDVAAVAADASNTTILLNGYGIAIEDSVSDQITTFRFTADAVDTTQVWEIDGFRAFNDAAVGLTNLSVLDLRDLGVQGLADITISYDAATTTTTITSNEGLNFEITLIGVDAADLSNENFAFAA